MTGRDEPRAAHAEDPVPGPPRPIRSVSVLVPTWQGVEFLGRSLEALARQELDLPWDLLAVDSGSTDGTWELLETTARSFPVPMRLLRIDASEFDHGDTRNLLAARSSGDLLVFLTQDAIPTSPRWLATLVRNFADPRVAAASCRNVPRADADLLTKLFSEGDPGYAPERREARIEDPEAYARMDPHARRLLYNFNDVASAIRRDVWERHPFPRTSFGEDLLMARALLEGGFTVVHDVEATVEHSHDYGPDAMRERARIDGRFNAEWLGRTCVASVADARTLAERQLARDREALAAAGRASELTRAAELRRAAFEGLYEGGLVSRRRPRTRLLPSGRLKVLYVVHGFPPDTWAGTEVYTLELAKEIQRLGHGVSVLTRRGDAREVEAGGMPEFSLERDEFQGLPVWRMTHRIDGLTIAESYRHPRREEVFREVLDRERPDLVHFQHLLHFSAGLVSIAAERGLPTVITLNDYWGLCARVQLIRPDGVRCEENQGLGCLVCVKDRDPHGIPGARRWYPLAAPLVSAAELALSLPGAPSVKAERILEKRRIRLRRWARSYRELAARQPYVLGNLARCDLVTAPSRFLRSKYLATGRLDPERVVYSDYGMRTGHLADLGKTPDPEGRVRFGFIGSLVWYKGIDVLCEAMGGPGLERAVLHVFGDHRPESEPFHAELARKAPPDRVRFHGRFDNERLAEIYREIDVLVVPSVWFENSPLTIHEAFLLRTPVVTSGIGGMAELVTDGVDGLHFAVGDAEDLRAKLRRFVDEPDLVERLSRRFPAIKTIEENAREMEWRYRALRAVVRE